MTGFFVISTHLGGAEKSLIELLLELKEQKKHWMVITSKDKGPLVDLLNQYGFEHKSLGLSDRYLKVSRQKSLYTLLMLPWLAAYSLVVLYRMQNLIKTNHINTIHSTGLKFHILLGLLAWLNPTRKYVLHLRDIIHRNWLRHGLKILSRPSNIQWLSNSYLTQKSLEPIPSYVIYNGFIKPQSKPRNLRKDLSIPENAPLIGIVAVIARWKGQREFLQAARQVLDKQPNCHFLIVGSEIYDTGSETGELEALKKIAAQNLPSEQIHFLPFQTDIQTIYQNLDVLVHASIKPEPFGRVIVEAMMEGVCVTASDQGGPVEIIEPKVSGLLHKQGDPQSMADNILSLLNNNDLRNNISAGAQKRSEFFSMEHHKQKMAECLGLTTV